MKCFFHYALQDTVNIFIFELNLFCNIFIFDSFTELSILSFFGLSASILHFKQYYFKMVILLLLYNFTVSFFFPLYNNRLLEYGTYLQLFNLLNYTK